MNRIFFYLLIVMAFSFTSCGKKHDDVTPKETVVYQTDFSSDDGKWKLYQEEGSGYIYYQDGFYIVASPDNSSMHCIQSEFFGGKKQNMAIEASIVLTKSPTHPGGNDEVRGGLIFGFKGVTGDDDYQYNVMALSTDGFLALAKLDKKTGQWTNYIQDKNISAIVHTDNILNKIRVELKNDMLYFYVNETEVHKMADVISGSLDKSGFWVNAYTILLADNFKATVF